MGRLQNRLLIFFNQNNFKPNNQPGWGQNTFIKGSPNEKTPNSILIEYLESGWKIEIIDKNGLGNCFWIYEDFLNIFTENGLIKNGERNIKDVEEAYNYIKNFFAKHLSLDF